MPKTVGVAVSNATFHFDKLYTYAVMPDQQDTVRLGSMVLVPFGRGSRARMGVFWPAMPNRRAQSSSSCSMWPRPLPASPRSCCGWCTF